MFRDIQNNKGILKNIQTLLGHTEPYSVIFITLYNPYIYHYAIFRTLAYLESQASSKTSGTSEILGVTAYFNGLILGEFA